MSEVWQLFPFPTATDDGHIVPGSVVGIPSRCATCPTMTCLTSDKPADEAQTCYRGVDYLRIDEARTVIGISVVDGPLRTKAAARFAKRTPDSRVKASALAQAARTARGLGVGVVADFEQQKSALLEELRKNPEMHRAMASELKREFELNLDQSHDFLQLVTLVKGHAEALLGKKYPERDVLTAAEGAKHLGAIYFSTELMLVKMDSLQFLREVNLAVGESTQFQIHPFVLKYKRIYEWAAHQKNVKVRLSGECFSTLFLNAKAVGAVIQGLLDNMIKYAPPGSSVHIDFVTSADSVRIDFEGPGPRIENEEIDQIFLPGYRGIAARTTTEAGLGIGLATAKSISDALRLDLSVWQSGVEDSDCPGHYTTRFSVSFPVNT